MNYIYPINQTKLYGLEKFINELIHLENSNNLPNKILLSGQKGLGKSTLAFHFINYVLSKEEEYPYDIKNFEINNQNQSFKTISNKSNINFTLIDISDEKKSIDINQIRNLIINLKKSSFNNKPRFILIDNIEFLNINSINALLKILEEPSLNAHFILINNNKRILPTLLSRCINFKIHLSYEKNITIANRLLNNKLYETINKDLINYYSTPGTIYNLAMFAEENKYDLSNIDLKEFIKLIIKDNLFKKENLIKHLIFDFIELYFSKIDRSFFLDINSKYNYFLKKISDTKKFNLDEESLFIDFEEEILNG
tara:strand:- start:518 stop:1450 length:933 start_codon:yes stop_codon:yes gene_type:complete